MDIVMICGLCITAAILCKVIEKDNKEISIVIALVGSALVLFSVITQISQIAGEITGLFSSAEIPDEYPEIIFKALGICYITQIGSDCCRDCGENSLASAVETFGRISVLVIAIPAFRSLSEIIKAILD